MAKPSVYTWKDKDGVIHYSSRPADPEAKAAKLPPINHGDVKIVKQKLLSCSAHGGVDCQAGADEDGSIICHDGFRKASSPYRFTCNAPKLQITEVTPIDVLGNFEVVIRNAKSVKAIATTVRYAPPSGTEVALDGPKEIEPYGVVRFRFEPKDADIPTGQISLAELEVKCANCP